jgi:hypothetical protein
MLVHGQQIINHKGASGSAVRSLAKSRAGRESGERGLAGRQCAVAFRSRISKGSSRLYEVRFVCLLSQRGEAVGSYIGWRRGIALGN